MYYICKPPNLSELTPVISKYGVNPLRLEDLHISSTQGVKEAQGFPFRSLVFNVRTENLGPLLPHCYEYAKNFRRK